MESTDSKRIVFYGRPWCGDCRRSRKLMDSLAIDYIYIDIFMDSEGEAVVMQINQGNRSVPTIVFPDGSYLVEPTDDDLQVRLEPYLPTRTAS